MKTLILDSNNIVAGSNNTKLIYQLPGGNIQFVQGQRVALSSITLYNSTPNITTSNQNTSFSYTWLDGNTYVVNIPDGNYDIPSLNTFFQSIMLNNGHYLVENSSGQLVFFITMTINATYYAVQLTSYPLNATIYPIVQGGTTAGTYSYGTRAIGNTTQSWSMPTITIVPIFVVLDNNFQYIIGFKPGSYPNSVITNNYSLIGQGSQTGTIMTATLETPALGAVVDFQNIAEPTTTIVLTSAGGNTYNVNTNQTIPAGTTWYQFANPTQTPSYSTLQASLSSITPQVSPLSSYLMTCSLINNKYAIPNSLLYSFPPKGAYGVQYEVAPYQLVWIDIIPGQYNQITITLTDQLGNPTTILDPNMTILIAITDPQDHTGFPLVK